MENTLCIVDAVMPWVYSWTLAALTAMVTIQCRANSGSDFCNCPYTLHTHKHTSCHTHTCISRKHTHTHTSLSCLQSSSQHGLLLSLSVFCPWSKLGLANLLLPARLEQHPDSSTEASGATCKHWIHVSPCDLLFNCQQKSLQAGTCAGCCSSKAHFTCRHGTRRSSMRLLYNGILKRQTL